MLYHKLVIAINFLGFASPASPFASIKLEILTLGVGCHQAKTQNLNMEIVKWEMWIIQRIR